MCVFERGLVEECQCEGWQGLVDWWIGRLSDWWICGLAWKIVEKLSIEKEKKCSKLDQDELDDVC